MRGKAAHIVLVIFLVIATSGISVTKHYCGYTFESFSLFSNPESCCGHACTHCHNVKLFYKISDDYTDSAQKVPDLKSLVQFLFSNFFIEPFSQVKNSGLVSTVVLRKFLILPAGDLPVLLNNYRC